MSAAARYRRGFTLIEMVVVLAILGTLLMGAVPLLEVSQRRAQETTLREALRGLRLALDAHKRAADTGRIAMREGDSGYPASLEVLVEGVPDLKNVGQRIYFLRRLPRDPTGDAGLPAAQTWGLRAYASPPDNPSAGRDVFDVYSLSQRQALDGSSYRDW